MAPLVRARRPSSATVAKAATDGSASTTSATRRSAGGSDGRPLLDAGRQIGHATDGTLSTDCLQQPLQHGGAHVHVPLHQPGPTGRGGHRARREHGAADVDVAVQRAAEAQRAWAARPVPGAGRGDRGRGRGAHRPQGRAGRAGEPGGRQGPHRGRRRGAGGHRHGRLRRRAGSLGDGRGRPLGDAVEDRLDHPDPRRRGRDDHAVELPDGHPELEDLPRPARRQRRGDEAVRAGAGVRGGLRRRVRRGGHPRRPRPGRARRRRAGRRAGHPPGRRRGVLHRLGAHRSQGGGRGDGGRAEAREPRAGRQERHGRARRRRPRPRARRRAVRCVRHLGPALHLHLAADRAARHRRPRSSTRLVERTEALVLGDPLAARHRRRPGDHRRLGPAHRRDDRGGRRRGRHGRHRRAPARRGGRLRGRHLRRAHDPHRREAHPHRRPRGGVRPGARRCSRSTTSTRRSAS